MVDEIESDNKTTKTVYVKGRHINECRWHEPHEHRNHINDEGIKAVIEKESMIIVKIKLSFSSGFF